MEVVKDSGLRKRQQIDNSSRKMFLWVAGASVIVGFSLVVSWFLFQQITFKDKVVNAKNQTVETLKSNNKAAPELISNIRVLETSQALNSSKATPQEKALAVILDALPAAENKLALGTSVQNKLVGGVAGVQMESFSVGQDSVGTQIGSGVSNVETIPFAMVLSASDSNTLRSVLKQFEASVRTIQIDSMRLEQSDKKMTMTITAHAFYMPAANITLNDKVVKP